MDLHIRCVYGGAAGDYGLIENRVHTPFTNDMLYDTFLGFMGIREIHYDRHCDLFSEGYNKMPEQLMTMYGNIWVSEDAEGLRLDHQAIRALTFPEDEIGKTAAGEGSAQSVV